MLKLNTQRFLIAALFLLTANNFAMGMKEGNLPRYPEFTMDTEGNVSQLSRQSRRDNELLFNRRKNVLIGLVVATGITAYAAKKAYDNRETLIKKAKNANSYVSTKLENFGNFLESKNIPGKWLVDGAKFGWKNKIATLATYIVLDNYIMAPIGFTITQMNEDTAIRTEHSLMNSNNHFPFASTTITLILCKLGSIIEKHEIEQAKKAV